MRTLMVAVLGLLSPAVTTCTPPSRSAATPVPSNDRQRYSLAALPLLEQPRISVDATGQVQRGRHVEMAALVTNPDSQLDGREATVTLVAMDATGRFVSQATVELASIPADSTVAVSAAVELDSDTPVAQVRAFVAFGDAAITRAQGAKPLAASQLEIGVDGDTLRVTGRLPQRLTYPGRYRVDAVLVDPDRAIVASARSTELVTLGPDGKIEWATFTAKGRVSPGLDVSSLRSVVTVMPIGDGS